MNTRTWCDIELAERRDIARALAEVELINLTPHTLNIHEETDSGVLTLAPSGEVARVSMVMEPRFEPVRCLGFDIEVYTRTMGEVEGLPGPREGTVYIVAGMVLSALGSTRPDVMAPGALIRDDAGRPIGCKGLVQG